MIVKRLMKKKYGRPFANLPASDSQIMLQKTRLYRLTIKVS
jgi:hypothetical protein